MPRKGTDRVTIRPGYMIRLSVVIQGGVQYRVQTVDAEKVDADGQAVAKWETTRIVADRAEHDAAVALRAKIRNTLTAHCCRVGEFGLMAPDPNMAALRAATEEMQGLALAWNQTARTCRVKVAVMEGRVASDDEQAVASIRGEISEMLREVEAGIRAADPERIRKAANAARDAGQMLSADSSRQVVEAINAARQVARDMTRRVKEAGEGAADALRTVKLEALAVARSAFLDLDGSMPVEEVIAVPRALDFVEEAPSEAPAAPERPVEDGPEASTAEYVEKRVGEIVPKRSFDLGL